ncbi:DUF4332 domain-containing protein, partial [bacterium]|nr:DUF4332 domain-containing protein [bacterium]
SGGQLGATTTSGSLILSRALQSTAALEVRGQDSPHAVSTHLMSGVSPETFDAFYNVDLQNRTDQAYRAATLLRTQHGVPTGLSRWATDVEFHAWKAQADARQSQLEDFQRELSNANVERARLLRELEDLKTNFNNRAQALDVEIDKAVRAITIRIATIRGLRENLAAVTQKIAQIQAQIDQSTASVNYVSTAPAPTDRLAPLYERLDEIDNQIGRWRRVQTDIQNQRVRLRDEMVVWNDLSLESEEHPYFRSREILVSLESRLDDVENHARHWESAQGGQVDPSQQARDIVSSCEQMRGDLYGLCQELGSQYKHIRHKAAVAELKQLRRCYNEMGENIKRLINRRENTIAEIRQLDPAGAEAIMRAENQFCECARHEGFLEARRRLLGPVQAPVAPQVNYTVVHPDLTIEREQLKELLRQREEMVSQLPGMESELTHRESAKASLLAEREQLRMGSETEILSRISQLDQAIQRLSSEMRELQIAVEQDRRLAGTGPNPLIELASRYLQQMSEGDLSQVWLTSDDSQIQVSDRRGATIPVSVLGPGDQQLVTLSLCLAGLSGTHAEVPLMLDDVFSNIDTSRAVATASLLNDLGNQGQQILAFTCHRAVLDQVLRSSNSLFTTFELPQTTVSPAPMIYPDRAPYVPPTPPSNTGFETAYPPGFTQPPALSTYPYVKYPVAGNTALDMAEFSSQDNRVARDDYEAPAAIELPPSLPFVPTPLVSPSFAIATELTSLSDLRHSNSQLIHHLLTLGVVNVGQLLELDPDHLPAEFAQRMVSADQIDRIQAECWMMVCVQGMSPVEAKVLVASGIQEPEQLDTTPYDQLVLRVSRYLESTEGRQANPDYVFDRARVDRWYDSLRSTRDRWRRDSGYSRRHRRTAGQANRPSMERSNGAPSGTSLRSSFDGGEKSPAKTSKTRTDKRSAAPKKRKADAGSPSLKFYLDLTDHIEAAPSIGPRTAERFEKVGVVTISDFLRQTADSMATKINYKRISSEVIRQWQKQTRLVCRIPNLRGHDAQLLVACGITEPEDLATMNPEKVYGIVGPFSETKEGLKIIRSGKKPDLKEVRDWIDWASNHRNLQAA